MDGNQLATYQYLWDGSDPNWVLYWVNPDDPPAQARYLPVHEISATEYALIIEDNELAAAVTQQMLAAGVRVVEVRADPWRLELQRRLGLWVQAQRRARGWSPKDLARKVRIHPKHVLNLEQGVEPIAWWLLTALAQALDLSAAQVIAGANLHDPAATDRLDWMLAFSALAPDLQQSILGLVRGEL
jgi:transcriptional regulator with XRE-family HTH domain